MLVSREHRFIVALPSKCGTNSMRNMALKWERDGGARSELEELRTLRHRMDVPPGCDMFTRAMVVRNPYSRLVSMYEYLRRQTWEWKYKELTEAEALYGRPGAWTWFLDMLVEERSKAMAREFWERKLHGKRPWLWTDRLTEMAWFLGGHWPDREFPWVSQPVLFLHLENLEWDWLRFAEEMGWEGNVPVPRRNNATSVSDKLWPGWERYFRRSENMELAREFLGPDTELASGEWR